METSNETTEQSNQSIEKQFKSEWIELELEPIITIPQVDDLKTQLEQYKNCRIQILGKQVERIDTAALQLLLAFTNSPDVTVAWLEPSPELCNITELLGLSAAIGLSIQEN
ncbi:MAG: STAS domain-containing protein [Candidatus Marithrix sp.]|nr:STAS domain-containing protein [Candidatus Marithrix sp.]